MKLNNGCLIIVLFHVCLAELATGLSLWLTFFATNIRAACKNYCQNPIYNSHTPDTDQGTPPSPETCLDTCRVPAEYPRSIGQVWQGIYLHASYTEQGGCRVPAECLRTVDTGRGTKRTSMKRFCPEE